MRIYLACTVRGDRTALAAARAIRDQLERAGHHVLTTHLLEENANEAEAALDETRVFARDLEWLDACDVLVAEASGSSFGVGFEVGYVVGRADRTHQRIVLCYDAARRGSVSRLIVGNTAACCRVVAYRNLDDLAVGIRDAVGSSGPPSRP